MKKISMLSPRKFEILLDRPDHKFEPGEIVSGRVIVELKAPETIRGIKVIFEGEASLQCSETETRIENNKTVTYQKYFYSNETYVNIERYVLMGPIGSDEVKIQAGCYDFPFEFQLPLHIPSSFAAYYGGITYRVNGIVDRPWKLNYSTTKMFIVEVPHDLSQEPMIAIHDEQINTFCLCFMNKGSMKFNIFLPTSNYGIGDTIEVKINVVDKSTSVNLTAVELELERKLTFYIADKLRYGATVFKTSTVRGSLDTEDEIIARMEVPLVHFSNATKYCSYIRLQYVLRVILKFSGCHMKMSREYPIEIGSKSARRLQSVQQGNINCAPIPTAGALPFMSHTPMSTIPMLHNPRVFGVQSPTNANNELNQFASGIPIRTYGSILPTIRPTAPLLDY